MTPDQNAAVIDRLVADLARATGHAEGVVRLSYGLEPLPAPAARATTALATAARTGTAPKSVGDRPALVA